MKNTSQIKYMEYDIHGKGVPAPLHVDELEKLLKSVANKETYDSGEKSFRSGDPDPYTNYAVNARTTYISNDNIINKFVPTLKKCFPNLIFRVTGNFIYGPGDGIDEHTNANDPSDAMYITYATGKSKFSYRYSQEEPLIDTYDKVNGLTLRAFTLTESEPFTFHKVECESGYRVSIGIRYVKLF